MLRHVNHRRVAINQAIAAQRAAAAFAMHFYALCILYIAQLFSL